jgi:hypothetical protein
MIKKMLSARMKVIIRKFQNEYAVLNVSVRVGVRKKVTQFHKAKKEKLQPVHSPNLLTYNQYL